jgi:hypothetical protein
MGTRLIELCGGPDEGPYRDEQQILAAVGASRNLRASLGELRSRTRASLVPGSSFTKIRRRCGLFCNLMM